MAKSNPVFEAMAEAERKRAAAQEQAKQTQLSMMDNLATIMSSGKDAQEALSAQEDASLVVVAERDAMSARVDAANAQAKLDLGTDSEQGNYRLKKLANDREANYENAVAAEQIIFEKKSKTFLSDPLGWINAQVTIPGDIDVYNHFAKRHNMAEAEYDSIVNSTTATAQANNATKATISAAMADANLANVSALADKERALLKATYAQHNISGTQALQQLSSQQLGYAETAVRLQESVENFELRKSQMAASWAQRQESMLNIKLKNEQLEMTIEARAQLKLEQDAQTAAYNAGVSAIGGRVLTTPQVLEKLKNDKTGYQGNFVRYGQDIIANGGTKSDIPLLAPGMTAEDLPKMMMLASARPTGLDRDVYMWSANATNEVIRELGAGQVSKDPQARAQHIAKEIEKKNKSMYDHIDNSTDTSNIYAAPTPKQLADSVPVLTKYPKLQEIIKRSSDNPDVPIKDKDILEAVRIELKTNPTKDNFKEMAESLSHYYNAVKYYNNIQKGFKEKGLLPQLAYNAVIPTGVFGGNQTVDMSDPLQVQRILLKISFEIPSQFAPTN